jgi:anti-anti-sigma factor
MFGENRTMRASCASWPWLKVDVDAQSITLVGELDVATAAWLPGVGEVRQRLEGPSVRVELGGLTFVDCAGLRCLLSLEDGLRASGIAVRRGSTSRCVDRLLRVFRCLGEPRQSGSEIR